MSFTELFWHFMSLQNQNGHMMVLEGIYQLYK